MHIINDYTASTRYEDEEETPVSLESIDATDDLETAFRRIYGFDYQDEEERSRQLRREFWGAENNPYEEARQELKYIGLESSETSYDALEHARQAQEDAEKIRWQDNYDDEDSYNQEDPLAGRFSKDAYDDAEKMLHELMAEDEGYNDY